MTRKAEDYQTRIEPVGRFQIRVTSYRLGDEYVCVVDNVDPGANVARASAPTREAAESQAVEKARKRVAATKIHQG